MRGTRLLAVALVWAAPAAGMLSAAAMGAVPGSGHPWGDRSLSPDQRADLLLAQMTQGEKFQMMAGACDPQGHTGRLTGIPRLGIPDIYFNDGPIGVHSEPPAASTSDYGGVCLYSNPGEVGTSPATGMPAPIALAATFDQSLAVAYGSVVGDEARNKGNRVIFGPDINIMRVPQGGRTFEAYGEDPYLIAQTAVGWIDGLQAQGVIANVKHYLANNQENDRTVVNAVVDERTLHEIYMPGFEAAVTVAHSGSVMAAYNRVNGAFMTENGPLLNGVLKHDWGFRGFVLSDYNAQHSTVQAANAGEDLEMPNPMNYNPPLLTAAVASGVVSQATVDDHVHRVLRSLFAIGVFDEPALAQNGRIDFDGHAARARSIAEAGTVLLRNQNGLLPLDPARLHSIALIGPEADQFQAGGGSSKIIAARSVNARTGIAARAGSKVAVKWNDGSDPAAAAALAAASDVAVVFAHEVEAEGKDRSCMALECSSSDRNQDGLIEQIAAANPRTIVVLNTGAPVLVPWVDRVAAILNVWYPGEQGGSALAAILFGDVDPAGRLPVTFPVNPQDAPAQTTAQYPGIAENANYSEGVLVGYRHYDAHNITPRFAFGYGLSYTTFAMRDLAISTDPTDAHRATVEVTVANTGRRTGSEVVQVYVGDPGVDVPEPPQQLEGFAKMNLAPGKTARVRIDLGPRAFAHWDAARHTWAWSAGCYRINVGASSRDIVLRGGIPMGGTTCPAAPVSPVSVAGVAGTQGQTAGATLPNTASGRADAIAGTASVAVLVLVGVTATRRGRGARAQHRHRRRAPRPRRLPRLPAERLTRPTGKAPGAARPATPRSPDTS